uniref:Uncharacterized protein n=1 Tax=Anguilla anguilla TaxID=7936 RepID=A0A0E9X9H5_ANGAN
MLVLAVSVCHLFQYHLHQYEVIYVSQCMRSSTQVMNMIATTLTLDSHTDIEVCKLVIEYCSCNSICPYCCAHSFLLFTVVRHFDQQLLLNLF